MDLVFDHTQPCDEVEKTMTNYVNMNAIPLKLSVPTVLHYDELDESRMFNFYHPDKVGKIIYGILESFGEERSWKASVYFDHPSGFTHVFFGKNRYMVEFPKVFMSNVVGTA